MQAHLDFVPEFEHPVTVRQMIHHTSGIRDQWQLLGISGWRLDDVITTEQILGLMSRQRELNFVPGSEYLYSNMGYTLLAETAAAVSGMSFPEFTAERIFRPLGMERTHFHDDHEHMVPDRAYSYRPTPTDESGDDEDSGAEGSAAEVRPEYTKAVLSYANAGATSLFTTADDLARWLDNFRHETVGGPGVMEMMKTRGVLNSGDTIPYAHGLSIGDHRGLRTIGHGGADAGFRTQATWYPEANVGVVVLTNVANGNPGGRARQVAEVVLAGSSPRTRRRRKRIRHRRPQIRCRPRCPTGPRWRGTRAATTARRSTRCTTSRRPTVGSSRATYATAISPSTRAPPTNSPRTAGSCAKCASSARRTARSRGCGSGAAASATCASSG